MTKIDTLSRLMGVRLEADAAHAGQTIGVRPLVTAKVIEVGRIVADPDQPRKEFDAEELEHLAGSLRDHGQRTPVKVRWDAGRDRYVLIDGERRWRAAPQAGLTTLMATVESQEMTADRVLELQLIENALRTDLSAMEAGTAYRNLMGVWGVNQKELAKRLHISDSKVSRALAALSLPAEVRKAVDAGEVGAMSAVKKHRAKPAPKKSPKAAKPARIVTPAGVAIVTPKAGQTVADVLLAAIEIERQRRAA